MAIHINLDLMLVKRKVTSRELAQAIGLSETNLSLLKSGKVKGVRFASLDAICKYLDCQPGDILEYVPDDEG
jgi:putative transcriptional regulator